MKHQWSWLLMSFALAIGLASIFDISQYRTHELKALGIQNGRTWTVCPHGCDFASIQQAIDTAEAGDRIWIQAGTYAEHLVIRKTLALEGSGIQETIIKGAQPNKPLIFIPEGASIEVRLANLALVESFTQSGYPVFCDLLLVGRCPAGIEVGGPVKLSLYHIRLSDHSLGIWIRGPARVHLFESQIGPTIFMAGILLDNKDAELMISGSDISVGYRSSFLDDDRRIGVLAEFGTRQITVVDSTFRNTISVGGQAHITIINTSFVDTYVGLGASFTGAKVQAVILDSEFVESGLAVGDESQITVVNSRFKKGGINLGGQAHAVIYGSEIVENVYSSGVFLYGKVQVHLERNKIADNREWGVALFVPECAVTLGDRATPQISGRDNEIPDKDQPHGNKKGALCPADYPWPPGFRK